MGEVIVLGLAAAMVLAFAGFCGWDTRSWWAITWPLLFPVAFAVLGVASWVGRDEEECFEDCGFVFAFMLPMLSAPPVLLWVGGAAAGRLLRWTRDRMLGVVRD